MQKESHSRRNFKKCRIKFSFSKTRNCVWKLISSVKIIRFLGIKEGKDVNEDTREVLLDFFENRAQHER